MLSYLKRIFQKGPELISLRVDELGPWFHAQSTTYLKSFDGVVQSFYHRVKEIKKNLSSAREKLVYSVSEESVAPRVKNVVLGHRDNYAREIGILINSLSVPVETSVDKGILFAQDIDWQLDQFAQQTKKSFDVTRHLFHEEADDIAESLKELATSVREYQELSTIKNIPLVVQTGKMVNQLHHLKKEQVRMSDELSLKQKRCDIAERQSKQNDEILKKFMESDDFLDYQQLLQKKDVLEKEMNTAKNDVLSFFGQIDRALRKYQHQASSEEQKIIVAFTDDPSAALREDSTGISSVLSSLRVQLSTFRLKDTQKIEAQLNKDMSALRETLIESERRFTESTAFAEKHHVVARVREIEYKLHHFREQEGRLKKEIVVLQEQLASINPNVLVHQIERDVQTVFAVTIKVL
ncbi:MAG TPA: hypothetical protein VJK72_02735 [Candidatus Nanoarchaeia archaeon]|nr:hypothetical protein [Candidatus Nanoarchaeia archaeon]